MKIAIAALAAALLGTAAAAGTIANPFAADTAVLSLRNLDLATADGQQRLAVRVDQAARAVCGERLATIHIDLEQRARACRLDVAQQVREQIEARSADASRAARTQLALAR